MDWEPAQRVQKNDQGQYRALISGEWVPVARAQKNDQGQFRVLRSEGGSLLSQIPTGPTHAFERRPAPPGEPDDTSPSAFERMLESAAAGAMAVPAIGAGSSLLLRGMARAPRAISGMPKIVTEMLQSLQPQSYGGAARMVGGGAAAGAAGGMSGALAEKAGVGPTGQQLAETLGGVAPLPAKAALAGAKLLPGLVAPGFKPPSIPKPPAPSGLPTEAAERLARGKALGVDYTLGQATRDPLQLRQETQASQTMFGRPLAERYTEQNRALLDQLDALKGRVGGKARTQEDVGRAVTDEALKVKAAQSKQGYDALYEQAREVGDMAEPVPVKPLEDYLVDHPDPTLVNYVRNRLDKVVKDGAASIEELEGIRKAAVVARRAGGDKGYYAREVVKTIDRMTEGRGGELYRSARAAYAKHQALYENPEAISKITGRKASGDRQTALEDVWNKAVVGGSLEDLRTVKARLLTGPAVSQGQNAFRELQQQTIQHLMEEARGPLDEAGRYNISPVGFQRAYERIGPEKLNILFSKNVVKQIEDIRQVIEDTKTFPPRRITGSDTAVNFAQKLSKLASHLPIGSSVARGAIAAGEKLHAAGKAAAMMDKALYPGRKPQPKVKDATSLRYGAIMGLPGTGLIPPPPDDQR